MLTLRSIRNLTVCFLSLLLVSSCSGLKGFHRIDTASRARLSYLIPWDTDFKQALYKAQFETLGKSFSGIFILKPNQGDTSYRIVLLSEFGLNLMDMAMNRTDTKIMSCQEFLNRPVILNAIEQKFRLLLFGTKYSRKDKSYANPQTAEFATKSGRITTIFCCKQENQPHQMTKIQQRQGLWTRTTVEMKYDTALLPSLVEFNNSPVNQYIKLTLLKLEK